MTETVSRWYEAFFPAKEFEIATLNEQMDGYLKELGYGS